MLLMINYQQVFGKELENFKFITCPECGIIGRKIDFIKAIKTLKGKACPFCGTKPATKRVKGTNDE